MNDHPDAAIGLVREIRIVRRILRDWIRTLHARHDLVGSIEIGLALDPSPRFMPCAVLLPDGSQEIRLTHGTIWWAYLCARALTRLDNDLAWPAHLPTAITAPRAIPSDAATVRSYGDALLEGVPPEGDGFFVFLFVTILFGVIFHEAAHILRGHLHLLSAHLIPDMVGGPAGMLGMVDDGSDSLVVIDDVGRRDLEHDADAVAGFLFAQLLLGTDDLFPLWERNRPAENVTWGLIGYALFCGGIAESEPSSAAYPDAFSRLMSFFYGARQHVATDLPNDPTGNQASIDAFSVLASAERYIPYVAAYRILTEEAGLQARLDELDEIMSHMPALNRLLRPYWVMPSRAEDIESDAGDAGDAMDG